MKGFREAKKTIGLIDIGISGYRFMWEMPRGTSEWIKERLDRAMNKKSCISWFLNIITYSIETSESYNLLIFLDPRHQNKSHRKRCFCFEKMWLHEPEYGDVIKVSWEVST